MSAKSKNPEHTKTIFHTFALTSTLIRSIHSPITSLPIAITDAIGSSKSHRHLIPLLRDLIDGIRLRFHHHTPEQAAVYLAFHQQAANQLRGDQLGRAGKEALGKGWEILGNGSGGDGSGCWSLQCAVARETALNPMTAGFFSWHYLQQ